MDNKTINRKVATAIGLEISEERTAMFENLLDNFNETDDSIAVVIDGSIEFFNPCNDWGDAGPIIVENEISLNWNWLEEGKYTATGTGWENRSIARYPIRIEITDINPTYAAMLCFLKMKDAENA